MNFEEAISHLPESIVESLKSLEQNRKWHPEGSVYNHIKIVYEQCLKTNSTDLMICAIFHDLGKIDTSETIIKNGEERIVSYGHERYAKVYLDRYLEEYNYEDKEAIYWICENHMRAHQLKSGKLKNPVKKKLLTDSPYYAKLMQFCECDEYRENDNEEKEEIIFLF
jgi:hypothetical protein